MLRLPISASGVPLPRWATCVVSAVVSIALCFGTESPMARAETPPPSPSEEAVKAADSDGDGVPDRPDLVSAAVTARVLNVAVEDLSQRSETVRVLINPDGTSEQEAHAAPVWVKDVDGKWTDVDYTLVSRKGGGFAPKASPSTVLIDGGGSREFARLDLPGGGSTVWSWPDALPTPTVDGATATYAVSDGVDLLVTATALGVSTRIRINSAKAVAPEFTIQVRTDGVKLSRTEEGQLFFTDGSKRAGQTSTLTAWDARLDPFGDPIEVVRVDASLDQTAAKGQRTDQDLTLTTPRSLVDDRDVVYPITIDPDLTPLLPSQDTWGRTLTATDGTGNTATTTYDGAGRTKTFNDGKGVFTYTYDGTDNLGKVERRGLTTKIDLGYATGDSDTITGSYDPAGNLVRQVLPDSYEQTWVRNLAGQATAMTYTQTVAGAPVPILGFTQTYDHLGRVITATGPAGSRSYSYDDRARLVRVHDTGTEGCTTRNYTFTGDSNRTSLTRYAPSGDGACQTATAASTASFSYDQADRITNTGYVYDRMGRTTTIPKAHTDQAGQAAAGDLTVGYAANDMVASLQQTAVEPDSGSTQVRKQTFSLDGSDRVSTTKGYTDTVQLAEAIDHYADEEDSPAWTQTKTRPDATTAWTTVWNRYISDIAGGLTIDLANDGAATLQLANLHGDIVATATLGQPGVNDFTETDEYGNPANAPSTAARRYGWLGTHQRDSDTVGGLTLMGARLYNPTTGRFLSIDPVDGGNDNAFTYPPDPINKIDLDGHAWFIPFLVTACRLFCARIGTWVARTAAPTVRRWVVNTVGRAASRLRAARAARVQARAKQLHNRIRKNSVTIRNRRGEYRYDLVGRAHYNKKPPYMGKVPTPHYTVRRPDPRNIRTGLGRESNAKPMKGRHVTRVWRHCRARKWAC